jgi:hypothetical protein
MTRLGLAVLTTAAALLLAACSGTATPPASPGDDAAKGFCDAMVTVTEAAPAASVALNGLFDEISSEANYAPGVDLSNLNTAGSTVVSTGGAYIDALEAAQGFANADSQADFDAIIDYWRLYGIALGEFGADADDFVAFLEQARPLIESEETAALSTAQRSAADRVASAYADACSS